MKQPKVKIAEDLRKGEFLPNLKLALTKIFQDRFWTLFLLSAFPITFAIYSICRAFLLESSPLNLSSYLDLTLLDQAIFESILILIGIRIAASTKRVQVLLYPIIALVLTALLLEGASLLVGGEFLNRLAIENVFHSDFVLGRAAAFIPIVIVSLWIGVFFCIQTFTKPRKWSSKTTLMILAFSLFAIILANFSKILPETAIQARQKTIETIGVKHTGPLQHFARIWIPIDVTNSNLSSADIMTLRKFGITIDPSSEHPLIHRKIYETPSPLRKMGINLPKAPNVVLLFAEGISARSLNPYNESIKKIGAPLTPFIEDFSRSGIMVKNYWSHTAASYRGMRGQLCSMFPLEDGIEQSQGRQNRGVTEYLCLSQLLKGLGYKTTFVNAHIKASSFLDELFPPLGFDHMLNAEELSKDYLRGAEPGQKQSLGDDQFFDALYEVIANHDGKTDQAPFFISAYNLGTHAWFDVTAGEKKYGDGRNNALNTIHNFDYQFGLFWSKFQKLALANNTIFIFTTDHCHYTEASFVAAFDAPDYQKQFIDKIPLIVQVPGLKGRVLHDAANATSVNLAPTIAHIMELPNKPTPWVGRSIFERGLNVFADHGIAGYQDFRYLIVGDKLHRIGLTDQPTVEEKAINRFFNFSGRLEEINRVWPGSSSSPFN